MLDYTYDHVQSDIERITHICQRLVNSRPAELQSKSALSARSFIESLNRLVKRYGELLAAEEKKLLATEESMKREGVVLEDLQFHFVDKTEAFHQQMYASLSNLVLALNNLRPHKKLLIDIPIGSIERFLAYIDKVYGLKEVLPGVIDSLNSSRDFRSRFVDHPQQHGAHNWYMYSYGTGICIVYYLPDEDLDQEVIYVPTMGYPYVDNFQPIFKTKSCYVSPNHHSTFKSAFQLSIFLLETYESVRAEC